MNRRPHEFISCDVHVKHNVNLTNLRVESKEKHACTLHIYRHEHVRTYSGLHAYVSVGSVAPKGNLGLLFSQIFSRLITVPNGEVARFWGPRIGWPTYQAALIGRHPTVSVARDFE